MSFSRETFELFLIHEARLLDERRFREWMNLFTEDGSYWVPAVPNQQSPFNQASLFYDDRQLMKTRIERLEHPLIHVQSPPSNTVHLVGNVTIESRDDARGEVVIASSVIMTEYRQDTQRIFGVDKAITVIPNFLDCGVHRRHDMGELRRRFVADDESLVIHVSNFRPVKRIDAVMGVFERIRRQVPARLLLVGDGPELQTAYRLARELEI